MRSIPQVIADLMHPSAGRHASGNATPSIPFRVRIGVTGHRVLPEDPRLVARIQEVRKRILLKMPDSAHTPTCLAVVSALAEGADRLVASEMLNDSTTILEAILPLQPEDYLTDFASEASRREFEDLLAQAQARSVVPSTSSREEAYALVGDYILDRADVLIALWDGRPARGTGGTAEVVARARQRNVPVYWIETTPPFPIWDEPGHGLHRPIFDAIDTYNQARLDATQIQQQVDAHSVELADAGVRAGLETEVLAPFSKWILPAFVKADILAKRYQWRFFRLGGDTLFALGALAVSIGVWQWLFYPNIPALALPELISIVAALSLVWYGRRRKWHDRWISCRVLAEHLRALLFLTLAGVSTETVAAVSHRQAGESSRGEWQWRVLDELWYQRPNVHVSTDQINGVRKLLATTWIGEQRKYQEGASARHRQRHRQFTLLVTALFICTLVASTFHILGGMLATVRGHGIGLFENLESHEALWVFLAVALPACAGALAGIDAQREHLRQSERSHHMAAQLRQLEERMKRAESPDGIRSVAKEAEHTILGENRDWLTVMRPRELELPV